MTTIRIQTRRGTASQWNISNPTLNAGEMGFETDTGKFKIGTGSAAWADLVYASVRPSDLAELSQDAVNDAIVAGTGLDKTYNDSGNTITIDIDSTVATLSGTQSLTNKTISGNSNTVSLKTDTSENWTSSNPTLVVGQVGIETDTLKFKIGNGSAWNSITAYANVVPTNLNTTLGDYLLVTDIGDANGPVGLDANLDAIVPGDSIIFEGPTDNGFETTLTVTDPTADRTITFPNATGTVALTSDVPGIVNTHVVQGAGMLVNLNGSTGKLDIINNGVISLSQTSNQTAVSNNGTGGYTVGLANDVIIPNNLTVTGTTTLSGAPTSDLHAATKAYVDNVTAGLNFHQPVRVATTGNITLSGAQTIDGVSVVAGDRVLVKDQTTQTQNGLYVAASGAWSRAADADNTPDGELKGGDFCLVIEGTVNAGYGYICSNTSAITIGTTNVTYVAFNAAKAIAAGTGLTETSPGTLEIDTATTVDKNTAQTLTNKTVNLANNTLSGTVAEFNTALSGADFATLLGAETLQNKTISGSNNTVSNIGNGSLTNSSVTIGSTAVSLGATAETLAGLTSVTSSTFTGNLTGAVSGNASSATTLQTARTIAGKSFDGSANISIAPTDLTGVTSSAEELNILDGATLSVTELNYVDGVTSSIQTQMDAKSPSANPTFTGTVVLPATSSIGDVSATELGYLDGVTSSIQTQLSARLPLGGGTMTGDLTLAGAPTSDLHAATKAYVDGISAGLNFHEPVKAATTENITLSGTQTIDGVSLSVGDRVLVKNQTTQTENGIYVVASSTWSRSADADNTPSGELKGGDFTFVLGGTTNEGFGFVCSNTSAITIGSTNITYTQFSAGKTVSAGSGLTEATAGVISVSSGGITSDMIADGAIVNADINASAAIDQSKIANLTADLALKEPSKYSFTADSNTTRTISGNADKYKLLRFTSSSATTVTVPTDAADANWAVGDYVDIVQYGSGQITFSYTGVTLRSAGNQYKTRVQYSNVTLIKIASNEWLLIGDTVA